MPSGVYPRKKKRSSKSSKDPRGNRYGDEVKAKARRALERGTGTAKEIARELGVSVFTIKDWKKEWGITKSRANAKNKTTRQVKNSAPKADMWGQLATLIAEYAEAYVADSWKGGGDPADAPIAEAQLALTRLKLETHMGRMKAELS